VGYVVHRPDGEEPRGRPIPGESDAIACVPYVPWRCPRCGDAKPRTFGQRGRVRYHECSCGLRYRSLEIPPEDLDDLTRRAAANP
jgi:hypothetical protein